MTDQKTPNPNIKICKVAAVMDAKIVLDCGHELVRLQRFESHPWKVGEEVNCHDCEMKSNEIL